MPQRSEKSTGPMSRCGLGRTEAGRWLESGGPASAPWGQELGASPLWWLTALDEGDPLIEAMLAAITIGTLREVVAAWSVALVAGVLTTQVARYLRRRNRSKKCLDWQKDS